MSCNFFHTNKKYFVFEKFAIKKQTAVLFFSAALFIELECLIDAQELPKNGDGLTKPGRFDFCGVCYFFALHLLQGPQYVCF